MRYLRELTRKSIPIFGIPGRYRCRCRSNHITVAIVQHGEITRISLELRRLIRVVHIRICDETVDFESLELRAADYGRTAIDNKRITVHHHTFQSGQIAILRSAYI